MNYIQPNYVMFSQEMQAYAARQRIAADTRLYEHQIQNQMDIQKSAAIEMQKSDISKEKEKQKDYLLTGPDGEEYQVSEGFLKNLKIKLPVRNLTAFRLHVPENREESVLLIRFQYYSDGEEKEKELFLDEKRLGDQKYVRQVFDNEGIRFGYKSEDPAKKARELLIGKAQAKAQDKTIPEIPGWYRIENRWEYGFPSSYYWKEVKRWAL